jgi:hypothetical protein
VADLAAADAVVAMRLLAMVEVAAAVTVAVTADDRSRH